MTTGAAQIRIQRLDLEQREAFLLNSLYAIGIAYTAGDEKQARQLVNSFKDLLAGPKCRAALVGLANNMRLAALTIGPEDTRRMANDP